MKRTKKIFAAVLTLALMMVFIPTTALAAPEEPGVVMVTVANNTYAEGAWNGELFSAAIDLEPGMTLGDVVQAACDEAEVSVTFDYTYGQFLTGINGLDNGAGAGWSGWTVALNNWMMSSDLTALAEDGDWISLGYSMDGGADLGSLFSPDEDAYNKTLQQIVFEQGSLDPEFAPGVHEYTLTVPKGTESLFVMPLAFNLNYQVRTSVDGTEYKLMNGVPVAEGTVITIVCGDPSWPSMNNSYTNDGSGAEGFPAETYTITIAYEEVIDNGGIDENGVPEVTAELDGAPKTGDTNMMIPLAVLVVLTGAGAVLTVRRRTE